MNTDTIITTSNYLTLIVFFLVFFGISAVSYFSLLKRKEFNFMKKKNATGERFSSQSKPIYGGMVFFGCIILAFVYIFLFCSNVDTMSTTTLLICCVLAFGMGFVDDLNNFSPIFKLVFQILCALLFIFSNDHIATSDNIFLNSLLTIVWVVGIMNSINMLDNMDGITSSVSLIIGLALTSLSHNSDTFILLALLASLSAFLIWNWNPAKMYMGDNGSQLLGVLLSYFSIKYVWNSGNTIIGVNYEQIIFISLMFLIPMTDTITVAINRFIGGRSPFVGDKYHTTHCLVYKGFSISKAVLLLDIITLIGSGLAWYFIKYANSTITITEAAILASFATFIFLWFYFFNLRVRKEHNLLYKKNNE